MIQNKHGALFVCEIKFFKNKVGPKIVQEVKEKIKRLKYPKGFAVSPVLIHINGVEDSVTESEFFSHIIDFSDFLL